MSLLKTIVISFVVLLAGCSNNATTEVDLSVYEFEGLEEIKGISGFRMEGWTPIDNRSLIVRTSPRKSYLFVLVRPDNDLRFANSLVISNYGGIVNARFDTVTTLNDYRVKTPIAKIYKLKGKEDVEFVKTQILGGASKKSSADTEQAAES